MHKVTQAIHASMEEAGDNSAIVPPVHRSTIYEIDERGHQEENWHYTRLGNPNRKQWERVLSTMEEGAGAAAFSSGVAAASAVFQSLNPGDHVIIPDDVYAGNRELVKQIMKPWGLQADFVNMSDTDELETCINDQTKLIWIETPSNPLMRISDIEKICRIAHQQNITVCVDNTWPTPINQLPLKLGADLVLHSTTKYFGGHSDILGGAIVTRKENQFFERIRRVQRIGGAVPSPEDCWRLSRSTRTLPYRMRGHNENAKRLADFFQKHPKVAEVFYPGLSSHDGFETAQKQMSGFGGMISFLVDGDREEALKIVSGAQLISRATSLGGVESTWEHRRSSVGEDSRAPENMIRISVGLEHPEDLMEDLEQAFE